MFSIREKILLLKKYYPLVFLLALGLILALSTWKKKEVLTFLKFRLPFAFAISSDTLDKVRTGTVYVRSDGTDTVTISDTTSIFEVTSRYLVINPDGTNKATVSKHSSAATSSVPYTLSQVGDYKIVPSMPYRTLTVASTAKMVLETGKRRRTFRDINDGHAATRMYFYVPPGTPSFTFYAMANRGDSNAANQSLLYNPAGSTHATLNLTIDSNGETWSSTTVNSPTSGYWSASINVASSQNNSEGTYWVDGVDNYFAPTTSDYFTPTFADGSVDVNINMSNVLGERGMIGSGRVYQSAAPPTVVRDAFLDIGLEANEVGLNHAFREATNDNSNAFSINAAGYSWSNQAVNYTVDTLLAEPIILLHGMSDWLKGALSDVGCDNNDDNDCYLKYSSVHDEWAEFALATLQHYNVTNNYGVEYIRLTDECTIDEIPGTSMAALHNKVASRMATAASQISSVHLYSGVTSEMTEANLQFLTDVIDNANPNYHQFFGLHPWNLGYGSYGGIWTTPFLSENIDYFTASLSAKGGPTPKKVMITEVNAKFGDSTNQDDYYYETFDHSLWWWSMMINSLGKAKTETLLYYPFEDTGSKHNTRGMVFTNGTYKHVAYATKHFMQNVQDQVIETQVQNSNLEVEAMTTADTGQSTAHVALVNKENRTQVVDLNVSLSAAKDIDYSVYKMSDTSDTTADLVTSGSVTALPSSQTISISMAPYSLYSVVMSLETPTNTAPSVNAGPDQSIAFNATATLDGTVSDDGFPNPPASLTYLWEQTSGPGTTTFGNNAAVDTTATFSAPGLYILRLTANDGGLTASDLIGITVASATPTPSPTPSFTPSPTPTPSFTPSPTPTPSFTPSPTPSPTDVPPTPSFTPSPTPTPSFTPSPTPTPSFTSSPTPSPTDVATSTPTPTSTTQTIASTSQTGQCNDYCADNSECGSQYTCSYNRCRLPGDLNDSTCSGQSTGLNRGCNEYCANNSECNSKYTCSYNRCRLPDKKDDASCSQPTDVASTCNKYCADNTECYSGLVCFFNRCRLPDNNTNSQCVPQATATPIFVADSNTFATARPAGNASTPIPSEPQLSTPLPTAGAENTPTPLPRRSTQTKVSKMEPVETSTIEQSASTQIGFWRRLVLIINEWLAKIF